jgi:hypothetical protein
MEMGKFLAEAVFTFSNHGFDDQLFLEQSFFFFQIWSHIFAMFGDKCYISSGKTLCEYARNISLVSDHCSYGPCDSFFGTGSVVQIPRFQDEFSGFSMRIEHEMQHQSEYC